MTARPALDTKIPAFERLKTVAGISEATLAKLYSSAGDPVDVQIRRELQREGQAVTHTSLVLQGWGARVRFLPDGRRQLLTFLLPGDLIGFHEHANPIAASSSIALTAMMILPVPNPIVQDELKNAFRLSRAMDEAYMLAQITRIGRMSARERLSDLLLELYERMSYCGLAEGRSFPMPLTQEMIADALGLTPVHLNRMVQQSRKLGELAWVAGRITFDDPEALAKKIGRLAWPLMAPTSASAQHNGWTRNRVVKQGLHEASLILPR